MKRTFNLLVAIAALNLSGCMLLDGQNYHVDRGDLVSNDGGIRYVGWCESHPSERHCGPARVAIASARDVDISEYD